MPLHVILLYVCYNIVFIVVVLYSPASSSLSIQISLILTLIYLNAVLYFLTDLIFCKTK